MTRPTLHQPAKSVEAGSPLPSGGSQAPPAAGFNAAPPPAWPKNWFFGLLLVAATFVAYYPAWHGGFIWDDESHVVHNRLLFDPDGLRRIWFSFEAPQYYPLVFTSFRLERPLWGLNPAGYHFVNLLLHSASALLLWRLLRQLGVRGAWLAAAVFALHPVNVESVAWITERKNTLSLFFFLLSLLLYLCSDQPPTRNPQHVSRFTFHALFPLPAWLFYGLSLFAFVLALFSKTAVAPLPVVLWLLAWWRRGRVAGRDVWRTVPFFTVALLLIPLTVLFEHHAGSELVRNDPFGSRLAGAGWAFWFYLYKAVLPLKLMFIYPRWRIAPADLLSYVPGLLVVAGFGVCWRYRRGWGRAGLFGLGYFLVMLLPALGFVNIYFMRYSLVSDHWQYFAIIGPIALAVAGLARALGFLGNRMPFLPPVVSAALLLALALLTWRQSAQYFDTETLWRTTIAKNPACWMAHNNLGILMITNRKLDDAVTHLREAIRINPEPASPWYNLAIAYTSQHHLDAAVACDQEALRRDPNNPKYLNDLAWIYATCPNAELRNGPEAVRLAAQACHLTRRRNLAMLDTLAAAFAEASQFDDAVKTTEELLARALSSHDTNTADTARLRLQLYQARTPYRDE